MIKREAKIKSSEKVATFYYIVSLPYQAPTHPTNRFGAPPRKPLGTTPDENEIFIVDAAAAFLLAWITLLSILSGWRVKGVGPLMLPDVT